MLCRVGEGLVYTALQLEELEEVCKAAGNSLNDSTSLDSIRVKGQVCKLYKGVGLELCAHACTTPEGRFQSVMESTQLSELLSEFDLTEKASEQPISDTHLEVISRTSSQQWRSLPPHLELPDTTVDDIEHDSHKEEERKNNFFFTWKHKKGSHATYRKLLESLLKIERRDDAEKVCKLLLESVATEHVHQKPSPRTLPGKSVY